MKYSLFLGCNIPARVDQYEASARAVLRQVDVQLSDIREFNCCGYPLRNVDQKAFLLSSAVNLALAEKAGLDMMTLCKCCFGSLKEAAHILKQEGELQEEIKQLLDKKNLSYSDQKGMANLHGFSVGTIHLQHPSFQEKYVLLK